MYSSLRLLRLRGSYVRKFSNRNNEFVVNSENTVVSRSVIQQQLMVFLLFSSLQ